MDLKDYLIIFMLIAIIIKIGRKKEKFTLAGVNTNVDEPSTDDPTAITDIRKITNVNNTGLVFSRSHNGTLTPNTDDTMNTLTGERVITYNYTDGTREVITKFADGRETHRITGSSGNIILDEIYTPPVSNEDNQITVSNNISSNRNVSVSSQSSEALNNLTAFIATGNGSNLELNGNVKFNGDVEFNSNKTTFKGANGTSPTHFPYVDADGVSYKNNYISGPTIFREGDVTFNSNISLNGDLTGNRLLTNYPDYNVSGININVPVGFNSTTFFKGANGAGATHFPYIDSNGNYNNNYISGPTIFREGDITFNDKINITKGFKTSYGTNEKITWHHNSVPSLSTKISMGTVSDGTYLVLATSNRDFTGMTTFTKKGNVIISSLKDNLIVKYESIRDNNKNVMVHNMWVEFNHPNEMYITVMFIKLTDTTF
jgi:hypothetical protein